MYTGAQTGVRYVALDAGRMRAMGGGTNHWGGWCRPMDAIDFETRDWIAHSGWPFARENVSGRFTGRRVMPSVDVH